MARISAREWRLVLVTSILVMALFSVPYLVGLAYSTPQMQFGGLLFDLDDLNSYLAKMRYGARAGWQFEFLYTSERHDGGYVLMHFLGLGKLAALISGQGEDVTAGTLTVAYHIARIACGLLLLAVMYRFLAELLEIPTQRFAAWLLAALGGGLGWILLISGDSETLRVPLELYLPEAFTFLLLAGLPHLALARSGMLIGWIAFLRACESTNWRLVLAAGGAWLMMGLIVPFYIALLGILIAVWLTALAISRRAVPHIELRIAALAGILPGLYFIYNLWLFTANPIFAAWSAQNVLTSPPPLDYLLAYGALLIPATFGSITLLRARLTHRTALLVIWPIVAALLVYVPLNFQRRLVEGVLLPLAALAVMAIWPYLQGQGRVVLARRVALGVVAGALAVSPMMFLTGGIITASQPAWPVFHSADELVALNWLADHAVPDSVVLAAPDTGMILPVHAPVRVFTGQGPEAINGNANRRAVGEFLSDGMTENQRTDLLTEANITYVWIGPPERALMCDHLGCFVPEESGLRRVYSRGDYTIYVVEGE